MSNSAKQDIPRPPSAFLKNDQLTQEDWEATFEFFSVDNNLRSYIVPRLSFHLGAMDDLPDLIDHTLLKVDADRIQVDRLCEEARRYKFKTVCVRLPWVRRCEENLRDTAVDIACVVGFHEGTQTTSEKVREAVEAVAAGAKELDMVMNYVELKNRNFTVVSDDIVQVRQAVSKDVLLKVILETSQLTQQDIVNGCLIAEAAGADFVKTSTGFNGEGAKSDDVALMKQTVSNAAAVRIKLGEGPRFIVRVKASGGIRDLQTAYRMLKAGALRLGTSSGVKISEEWQEDKRAKDEKRVEGEKNVDQENETAKKYNSVESEGRIGSRFIEPRSLNLEGPPSL